MKLQLSIYTLGVFVFQSTLVEVTNWFPVLDMRAEIHYTYMTQTAGVFSDNFTFSYWLL